jgi:hypothetical protein
VSNTKKRAFVIGFGGSQALDHGGKTIGRGLSKSYLSTIVILLLTKLGFLKVDFRQRGAAASLLKGTESGKI